MVKRPSSDPAATDAKWMSERAAIVFATTFEEKLEHPAWGEGLDSPLDWNQLPYPLVGPRTHCPSPTPALGHKAWLRITLQFSGRMDRRPLNTSGEGRKGSR